MTDRKTLIDAVDAETFTSDPGAGIECGNVDASELKPCPFCGGEVCFRYYSSTPNIHCEECGYERDFWDDDNHCPVPKEDAIAAWNTRYDLSLAKIEALEAKLARAKSVIKDLAYWFDTDQEILDAMSAECRDDHERQVAKINRTLAELNGGKDE